MSIEVLYLPQNFCTPKTNFWLCPWLQNRARLLYKVTVVKSAESYNTRINHHYISHLNTGLGKIQFSGQHFSSEDIGVMAAEKRLFQFFHLPRGKVGTRATPLVVTDAAAGVATVALFVVVT